MPLSTLFTECLFTIKPDTPHSFLWLAAIQIAVKPGRFFMHSKPASRLVLLRELRRFASICLKEVILGRLLFRYLEVAPSCDPALQCLGRLSAWN